ncbi:MAG: hypothetical protein ACE5KK_01975 [Candidatus Brocadiales bacterium]
MKTYTGAGRIGLTVFLLLFMLASVDKTARADVSTEWRHFVLGVQEYVADEVFKVENIDFLKNHDLRVKARIRNISKSEASIALSIAFFDRDKSLLTAVSFAPHFLMGGDIEQAELEVPGGGEVYRRIRYYQISIVEREEW